MATLKLTAISVIAVLIVVFDHADGFVGPAPVGRCRGATAKVGTRAAIAPQTRPQHQRACSIASRRQASMSASPGQMSSSEEEKSVRPSSRLARISGRVRKIIRKAVMGYVPEWEVSYKERAAQQAAAAARRRGEPEIADERLREASVAAKAAATQAVQQSLLMEDDDEDDILNSGFVQLNIGDQSPMEAEDKLASLRRRLEQGLPPDTPQEQAEKRRRMIQQQQRMERISKPASFDGDTAVAERPSSELGANQGATRREQEPRRTPKLASAEDVERLNRMFGSMGGEPLR